MRIVLTLLLICMAAGATYAQDLQSFLTKPAVSDGFVPDIVATASSHTEDTSIVGTLTTLIVAEAPDPTQPSGSIVCAHITDPAPANQWVPPPQLIQPTQGWDEIVARQNLYQSMYVTPEPGSLLVLAFGLGGLVTWRFRSRTSKSS